LGEESSSPSLSPEDETQKLKFAKVSKGIWVLSSHPQPLHSFWTLRPSSFTTEYQPQYFKERISQTTKHQETL